MMTAKKPLGLYAGDIESFANDDFISIANGGTGSTTATGALSVLGAAASGDNRDITSVGAITGVTAVSGDNSNLLATTEFVMANAVGSIATSISAPINAAIQLIRTQKIMAQMLLAGIPWP